MNEPHIEPTNSLDAPETAVQQEQAHHDELAHLFDKGWRHLVNQKWRLAEDIFAQITTYNSHYERDGLHASYLRDKAKYERIAEAARTAGDLETALVAFKKADDFEHVRELYELLTIQELETKAEKLASFGNYQAAAWIYDHLLTEFPESEKETNWQIKKESCWEAELLPYFQIGQQALEEGKWRTAYHAFAQVLVMDPYFRQDGRSAAVLSEIARKEVVLLADQHLRQGQVEEALEAYRDIGHQARIENVDEFLRLRHHEEESAKELEAAGKWQAAAAKYNYLRTLYYDENGRSQWQAAADRCLQENKLSNLYEQAITAFNKKQWDKAEELFRKIVNLCPDYQPGEEPARKLHRMARWRTLLNRFMPDSDSPPPRINTGNLS